MILPLEHSIIDIEYYMALMYEIVRFYKSDIACTDAARYYSPNHNQETYYSKGKKFFDVSKFEAMIENKKEVVFGDTTSLTTCSTRLRPMKSENRIDLALFMNQQVTYYLNGNKRIDTLDSITKTIKVSNSKIKCHCFINPAHEDKNPSCVINLNDRNIYVKCYACGLDGIVFKGENK